MQEGVKHPCRQCNYQAIAKGSLAEHRRAVHDGVKHPCRQSNYQATTKGSFGKHQRAVHEGQKYPYRQCNYQATAKGSLAKHQKAIHEGLKILADNAAINLLPNVTSQDTKEICRNDTSQVLKKVACR